MSGLRNVDGTENENSKPILQTNDNRMTWPSTRWDICRLLYVYRVAPALQNYAAGIFLRQKQVHGDGKGRAQCKRVKKMQQLELYRDGFFKS